MIEIKRPEACCGCWACVQRCPERCIAMRADTEGFLYPQVDKARCTDCGLCEKVCPVLHPNRPPEPSSVRAYACRNRDEGVRMASSSGGLFPLLAARTLAQGGVVFGARFDGNFAVRHDFTENAEGLERFRGAKYAQSVIGDSFIRVREFLKQGREVLFTGTSCQIAGLKRFLGRPYANLLAVDVLCHGVPSPEVLARYLGQQTGRLNRAAGRDYRLDRFEFRSKQDGGWERYRVVSRYVPAAGSGEPVVLSVPFTGETYMRGFLHDLYLRPACHECPVRRLSAGSDLTLADYWGVGRRHPEMDDGRGTSLVVALTGPGERALRALSGSLDTVETPLDDAIPGNPCLVRSVGPHRNRRRFFASFDQTDDLAGLILQLTRTTWRDRIGRKIRGALLKAGLIR